ncbi:MAG: HlyD family efflux transporter periplasmic adaptor subunit [Clostridia bacterium]|nr:HlyD family efflux transporter periplasmic adaptor subunit [Clostridia bacterium]
MTDTDARPAGRKKKKRRGLRRVIILLVVLAILGGGALITVRNLQAQYTVTYNGYTAARGTISNALSYTGTVQLVNTQNCTAPSAAKVREVYVAVGDRVKEGDKLVRLSTGETLKADFDGRVNKVDAAKGDEVTPGASLVQVADFDHMRVSFRIGESDINEVTLGQACRVTVPSAGAAFETSVATIDYASYSGNNVAYYNATLDLDTSGTDQIYPGMQATITLPQEEAADVVVLRMDALSTARDNTAFVYKQQEDGTMAQVPVTVGVSNGNYVEIKSGVAEGETVFAVAKQEETLSGWAAMLNSSFGSQRVNMPQNNNWNNGSNGGNSRNPGSQRNPGNRGN